jgi:hypothetical protein
VHPARRIDRGSTARGAPAGALRRARCALMLAMR